MYFPSSFEVRAEGVCGGGAPSRSVQTGANICRTPLTKLSGIEMDSVGKLTGSTAMNRVMRTGEAKRLILKERTLSELYGWVLTTKKHNDIFD